LFAGAIAVALRRLKYESRPDLAGPLGRLLCGVIRRGGLGADVVVPVPLHPKRLADRGYNQAALLGRAAARALSVPLAARALVRIRHTPQQAHLGREARLGNVVNAFHVRDPAAVRGLHVLLVDDVVTTGSTLGACTAALLAAGAASVQMLAVARARSAAERGIGRFSDEAPC
jgi:ComF family protein